MYRHKNLARSTLSAGITSGATSFSVATGEGAKFPQGLHYVTIWDSTTYGSADLDPNAEIIKISSRSSDTFTVATSGRGFDGTSAAAHNTGGKTYTVQECLIASEFDSCMRRPGVRHSRWAMPIHGGDLSGMGMGIFITGTSSTIAPTSTEPVMINYASAASSGSNAGVSNNGNAVVRTGRNLYFGALVKLQETAATRVWIGLFFSSISSVLGGDTMGDFIGFRYSTVASDTNWQACNGLVSQTTSNSGIAADTNIHLFEFIVDEDAANIKFYIDGALVATNTTNLPSGDNFQVVIGEQTQAAVAKNIRVGFIHVEDDL